MSIIRAPYDDWNGSSLRLAKWTIRHSFLTDCISFFERCKCLWAGQSSKMGLKNREKNRTEQIKTKQTNKQSPEKSQSQKFLKNIIYFVKVSKIPDIFKL